MLYSRCYWPPLHNVLSLWPISKAWNSGKKPTLAQTKVYISECIWEQSAIKLAVAFWNVRLVLFALALLPSLNVHSSFFLTVSVCTVLSAALCFTEVSMDLLYCVCSPSSYRQTAAAPERLLSAMVSSRLMFRYCRSVTLCEQWVRVCSECFSSRACKWCTKEQSRGWITLDPT